MQQSVFLWQSTVHRHGSYFFLNYPLLFLDFKCNEKYTPVTKQKQIQSTYIEHAAYYRIPLNFNNINKKAFHQVSPKNSKYNYLPLKDKEIKVFQNLSLHH